MKTATRDSEAVLIIAGGHLQLPAVEEARKLALRTIVVDQNPNAPGLKAADSAYVVDILDCDAVTRVAESERVGGVMTICTDAPVRTVAAVAESLRLCGLSREAAECATDKRRMRAAFRSAGAPSPAYFEVQDFDDLERASRRLGFPLALKIARGSGSLGVYRVDAPDLLQEYYVEARRIQPNGTLLVEEWLTGPEVSVEGICFNGDLQIVEITDKKLFSGVFPVEAGHSQGSLLPHEQQAKVRECASRGVRALGLDNCAFHAEIKMTELGPKLIEIGARLGGDRISTHLTPISSGVNLVRGAVQSAMGLEPDTSRRWFRGAAIRYISTEQCGLLESIEGLNVVRGMPGLELLFPASERDGALRPGFPIRTIRSSHDRYGHVIFSGRDASEAIARAEQAADAITLKVSGVLAGKNGGPRSSARCGMASNDSADAQLPLPQSTIG